MNLYRPLTRSPIGDMFYKSNNGATMPNFSGNGQRITPPRRKEYTRPTLVRGPVLARVTSEDTSVSGATCWIARAAFGEADIRWMIFRTWLLEDAPAWLRTVYLRHGETIGASLVGHEGARRLVRAAMMPAVRRKLSS
jgi:hypothetical protein